MHKSTLSRLSLFVVFLVLYEFNTYIANDMIMPGMLTVVHELNGNLMQVAQSLSWYMLGGSTLTLLLGPLCDIYGNKKVLLSGNILFLVASAIIGQVSSIEQFLVARYIQGMGLAFIVIGYTSIHKIFNDIQAVKLSTLMSNITIFAPIIGPVLGAVIIYLSDWRCIFVLNTALAAISLLGLTNTMPTIKVQRVTGIIAAYKKIFSTRLVVQGAFISSTICWPMIIWIALSPVIILEKMHLDYTHYVVYQGLIFASFICSSIFMQFTAGKWSFYNMIMLGNSIALIGLLISWLWSADPNIFLGGLVAAYFGIGLFNAIIYRIAIKAATASANLNASAIHIIQSVGMVISIEIASFICDKILNYDINSLASINLVCAIIFGLLTLNFAKLVKNRKWE